MASLNQVPASLLELDHSIDNNISFTPDSKDGDLLGYPWLVKFTPNGILLNRDVDVYKRYTAKEFSREFKKIVRSFEDQIWGNQITFDVKGKSFMLYDVKEDKFSFS